ncbi:trehalose-phosphatase [Parapusillimonas granuli]|uniref:Trehalose 6-phosphate phosphatase n=1 Tax=Parapusillimonas granuli TaxID=380911 RepID=A0A853FZR8_9BURK|nr:trehalose-phosphatase [Parapusillimonas granuli]MBB5214017.1 trehalose 6-phosphate phosphatase [Parapusillimonas granuli]NYT50438.1 trehalose-phosphatase [Parapusillimonas granuli]
MTLSTATENFLPAADSWAFFFDLDGTLAPLAERPDLVRVPEAMLGRLAGLRRAAGGALAVISGRPLDVLDELLRPLVLPLGAEHGAVIRDAGGRIHTPVDGSAVHELAAWLAGRLEGRPGVLLERKSFGVAVHYRLAPEAKEAVLAEMSAAIARFSQFELLPGKMVVEAKLPAVDKGRALLRLMGEPPFAGRRPLMVGDDTTDEAAFRQANALGGCSIKIGPGASCAALRLGEQGELEGWLGRVGR